MLVLVSFEAQFRVESGQEIPMLFSRSAVKDDTGSEKKGAVVNYELQLKRKDGKPMWVLANIRLFNDDQSNQILEGILADNTKRKGLEKELRRDRQKFRNLANHDNLTGLFNTRYLYKTLDELIIDALLLK